MKKYFLYIFLAIASFFAVSAQTAKNDVVNFSAPVTIYISSGQEKHTFEVERAITKAQQARGMMFREVMNKNSGMLFEFKEPKIASMWMKNTYIPLFVICFWLRIYRQFSLNHICAIFEKWHIRCFRRKPEISSKTGK